MHLHGLLGWLLFAAASPAPTTTPPPPAPRPAPRVVEIDGRAQVAAVPPPTTTKNGRKVLLVEVEMASYMLAPAQPAGGDRTVPVDMKNRIRVEHDLACGGEITLGVGDRVEFRGEYVELPEGSGMDLVRFTHAPGAEGCGDKAHPAGFLRKPGVVTPTAVVTAPKPAGIVPDQPYVGTPSAPGEKSYAEILRLKQSGATDEALLETIRTEKKPYFLNLGDVQALRAGGVSSAVIEAMMRSGRKPITPGRTPTP